MNTQRNIDEMLNDPAVTDAELLARLIEPGPFARPTSTADGSRRIYDRAAGLWFDDAETITQLRRRHARRRRLGSHDDTHALNVHEQSAPVDVDGLNASPADRRRDNTSTAY